MSGIDRDIIPDPRPSLVDGSQIPLYYGEIKIVKTTGEYHAIPRTSPRRTS
jgi:hypothetical protein